MSQQKAERFQRGFSLMELLLVIFIISLVYFLGFSGVEKRKEQAVSLTPLNLKKTIMESSLFQGEGTLVCINLCDTCYLRKDIASPFEPYEGKVSLAKAEAYVITTDEMLQKLEYGRYQDQKICLRFDIYPNGSSTQLILKTEEGIYFLPAYFGEAQKVESLDEAQELWLKHTQALSGQGDFY
jgi:prepilin-type N-terminal cleavage/methylation domain-containing protein